MRPSSLAIEYVTEVKFMVNTIKAHFGIGQIVWHNLFGYRGVIIDADACYRGTEQWYEQNAPGHPDKNKPWYYILVHGSVHHAYAAELHLSEDQDGDPIKHPELDYFFDKFVRGRYLLRRRAN